MKFSARRPNLWRYVIVSKTTLSACGSSTRGCSRARGWTSRPGTQRGMRLRDSSVFAQDNVPIPHGVLRGLIFSTRTDQANS